MSENNSNEKLTQQRRWNLSNFRSGPGAQCQKQVRPIYPARFSLTADALNKAAESGVVPPPPTGINDPNYNLRRLRQGYFYIYAEHPTVVTDGYQGHWLIFQYYVDPKDSNSEELAKESRGSKRYSFTQYIWKDGNPYGIWKKEQNQGTFPFAYVHPQTAMIEFAYSEYRWPPELFEKLESDKDARAKIMQRLELKNRESDFSFTWTEESLRTRVEDFNPESQEKDKLDSHRRATGIGYDPNHKIQLPPSSCKGDTPIVVAVYDQIGNLRDLSAQLNNIIMNDAAEFAKEIYPITTAKAISDIKEIIDEKPNWLKDKIRQIAGYTYPIKDRQEYEKYAKKSPAINQTQIENIGKVFISLLNQCDKYTPLAHLNILKELIEENKQQLNRFISVANYAMGIYEQTVTGFGDTPQGAQMLAPELDLSKSWGEHLSNLLSVSTAINELASKTAEEILIRHTHFDVFISSVISSQMVAWQTNRTNAIPFDRYLSAVGMRQVRIRINHSTSVTAERAAQIINEQMRALVAGSNDAFRQLSLAQYQAELTRSIATRSTHHIEMSVNLLQMNENEQAQRVVKITPKIGFFFAAATALVNLQEWTKQDEKADSFWLSPITRLTTDLTSLAVSYSSRNDYIRPFDELFSRIDGQTARQVGHFTNNAHIGIEQQPGQSSWKSVAWKNVGRLCNVVGVVISYAQYKLASKKGDNIAGMSALLAGASEASFLFSTFFAAGSFFLGFFVGIGVILIVGSVILSYVSDNDLESWVRNGFWGDSPEYWDKNRLDLLQTQLDEARILGNLKNTSSQAYERMKKFFEKEMQDYYNLVWCIGINTKCANNYILELCCPAFTSETCVNDLEIEIKWSTYEGVIRYESTENVHKTFIGQGLIKVDLSQVKGITHYIYSEKQQESIDTLTIKFKYPKLGQDLSNWFKKWLADYFETSVIYVGKLSI